MSTRISTVPRAIATLAAIFGFIPSAAAQVTIPSVEAIANATVQPAGPRAGANGLAFLNIEGNANGAFASFGTADYAPFTTPGAVATVNIVTISLIESNAAFTLTGQVNFYFASDTSLAITPGAASPNFIAGPGSEGVGAQLGTLFPVGSGNFPTSGNVNSGMVDQFIFNALDPTTAAYVASQLNSNSPFRLVITPGADTVAATWAGFSNTTFDPSPTLGFNVTPVPEPTSLALVGVGTVAGILTRRKRNAKIGAV